MQSIDAIQVRIEQLGIVPAIRCRASVDVVIEVGDALHATPLTTVIISLGSRHAWSIVHEFRRRYGQSMTVGVGPLSTADQARAAVAAGAQFVLSGRPNAEIAEHCRRTQTLYVPCVSDANQMCQVQDAEWRMVAFFPARKLGINVLTQLARSNPAMRFIALGGVDHENISAFAGAGAAAAVVRGVLGTTTRWRMHAMILQMRRLRARWEATTGLEE